MLRLKFDGTAKPGDGFGQFALPGQHDAELGERIDVIGSYLKRLLKGA